MWWFPPKLYRWLKHFPLFRLFFSVHSGCKGNCPRVNTANSSSPPHLPSSLVFHFVWTRFKPLQDCLDILKLDLWSDSVDPSPQRFYGRRRRTCPRISLWDDGVDLQLSSLWMGKGDVQLYCDCSPLLCHWHTPVSTAFRRREEGATKTAELLSSIQSWYCSTPLFHPHINTLRSRTCIRIFHHIFL